MKVKNYLSWSQMSLWEKDPELYKEVYIYGREIYETKYIELGKEFAQALEKGKSKNKIINHLLIFLPRYPKVEYEIRANLDKIPLLGRLDGFDQRRKTIGEFKTGTKYTQRIVDKMDQLTFYSLLVWLKYRKLPEEIALHWIETKNDNGELFLTGKIMTFKTKRTQLDLIRFIPRVKRAWEGICELREQFKKKWS